VNHTAPNSQSATPAKTIAPQFNRMVSPLRSVRGDNIVFCVLTQLQDRSYR
jgi:hypothetical protein